MGNVGVKRSTKIFSSIAIDQGHEQTEQHVEGKERLGLICMIQSRTSSGRSKDLF